MPSEADYVGMLVAEAQTMLGFAVGTRGDVDKVVAEARRRVIRKREALTKEITVRWKDGFSALKKENDQMQTDLRQAYRETEQFISETRGDLYEKVQR